MEDQEIGNVLRMLRREARKWPVPALGHYTRTPFTVLVACVLSLRTQDRTTVAASERLFAIADAPGAMVRVPASRIRGAIYPVSFYRVKTRTIQRICWRLLSDHYGQVPSRMEELLALPGVGRKTANIVLTLAFRKPGIAVDTHVHRITNRWGYVRTGSPEKTEMALRDKLLRRYWIEVNDLLVALGQNVCRPVTPWCSRCPVAFRCERVGVIRSR